jgi:hypothetical protein
MAVSGGTAMKKNQRLKWLLFLLVLASILFIVSVTSAFANGDEVIINPRLMNDVEVRLGQTVVIKWGLLNCNKGLSNAWIQATFQEYELSFDGSVILDIPNDEAVNFWGDPEVSDLWVDQCFWPAKNTWLIPWTLELPLKPQVFTT